MNGKKQLAHWMNVLFLFLLNYLTPLEAADNQQIMDQYHVTYNPEDCSTIFYLSKNQEPIGSIVWKKRFWANPSYECFDPSGTSRGL